jgi:hypothetical protein
LDQSCVLSLFKDFVAHWVVFPPFGGFYRHYIIKLQ